MSTVDRKPDEELLLAAIKFNAIVLGLVSGLAAALTVYIATMVSIGTWGDAAGGYLGLLGVFLPGYSPTAGGALIGAFWAFLFAGLAGSLTYWLYGRILGARIADGVDSGSDVVFKPAILRLHGVPLGIAVGTAVGLSLLISTLWLVVRGTADESTHAALLSNYLPGYETSILGGIIGAIDLFVIVFISCVILSFVYNKIVDIRMGNNNK